MIYLRTFKNFQEASFPQERPVTVLVGPNGSGKSNLIEAVELLSFLASGKPLHDITDVGRRGALEIRGGISACPTRGRSDFTLGFRGALQVAAKQTAVAYEITVKTTPEPRIVAESLRVEGRQIPVFTIVSSRGQTTSTDNTVRYDNHKRGRNKPPAHVAGDRSALSQYFRFAESGLALHVDLPIVEALQVALAPPSVFDPIPKLMRGYERDSDIHLARNGSNISPVLHSLEHGRIVALREPETGRTRFRRLQQHDVLSRLLAAVAQLPEEPFTEFKFIRTSAHDVLFGLMTKGASEPMTARLLSDGTLRALAVLTALETASPGRRLIIEEFDNGVHPSRVSVLTKALFACAKRKDMRVTVTTHNPATLNSLTHDDLDSVLLTLHLKERGCASLLPLGQLSGVIELLEKGRLGDLITKRVYEDFLSSTYEEERKKALVKWVTELP